MLGHLGPDSRCDLLKCFQGSRSQVPIRVEFNFESGDLSLSKSAVIYCRVSTVGQVTDGVSLGAQERSCREWAVKNGFSNVKVFADAGLSGKSAANRPELQKALKEATRQNACLVVYSLSRLARSIRDTLNITENLEKHKCDLVSLSESIDTTTAAGRMIFRLLATLAQFERELVSERTRAAMTFKKTQGERVGKIPFGFVLGADGKQLLPDASEQAILSEIMEMHVAGVSQSAIARSLNDRKVPSKSGSQWRQSSVRSILLRSRSTASN